MNEKVTSIPELFGSMVFTQEQMRQRLPARVYNAWQQCLVQGTSLDRSIADEIASAMKDWAIEKGATHYTHWFQPMTGEEVVFYKFKLTRMVVEVPLKANFTASNIEKLIIRFSQAVSIARDPEVAAPFFASIQIDIHDKESVRCFISLMKNKFELLASHTHIQHIVKLAIVLQIIIMVRNGILRQKFV